MLKALRSFELATVFFILLLVILITATLIPYSYALLWFYTHTWFQVLLFIFIAVILICCFRKSYLKGSKMGVLLTHISIILISIGGLLTGFLGTYGERGDLPILEREGADSFEIGYNKKVFRPEEKSYEVTYRQPGKPDEKKEERIMPAHDDEGNLTKQILPTVVEKFDLGFKIFLKKFRVERYGQSETLLLYTGGGSVKRYDIEFNKEFEIEGSDVKFVITGFYPDFMMGDDNEFDMAYSQAQRNFNNPALRVELKGPQGEERRYLFANMQDRDLDTGLHAHGSTKKLYPDFGFKYVLGDENSSISQYVSEVEIQDGGKTIQARVGVNEPLVYKGFRFYQSSYSWIAPTAWETVLMVKNDFGYHLIYLSFAFFLIGNILLFVYNPFAGKSGSQQTE